MTEKRDPTGAGASMQEWGSALQSLENKKILTESGRKTADTLRAPRTVGYRGLEEMNLPRYYTERTDAAEFLKIIHTFPDDPEKDWFISIIPKDDSKGLERFRRPLSKKGEIIPFIHESMTKSKKSGGGIEDYDIVWNEAWKQEYGGNVVVSKDGTVLVEFHQGHQGGITNGMVDPKRLHTIVRRRLSHTFEYSFEDKKLQELLYSQVLEHIPFTGTGAHKEFLPGYYEFGLVRKAKNGPLEPMFVDYRSDDALTTLPLHLEEK